MNKVVKPRIYQYWHDIFESPEYYIYDLPEYHYREQ